MKGKAAPSKTRARTAAPKKGTRVKAGPLRFVAKEFARSKLQRSLGPGGRSPLPGTGKRRPRLMRTIVLDTKVERAPEAVFQAPPQAAESHAGVRTIKGLGEVKVSRYGKRSRVSFAKIPAVLDVPNLVKI